MTPANLAVVERVTAFATARGITSVDVAMSWLLTRPAVTSILVGASTPAQLAANVAAATWVPTAADLAELEQLLPPAPDTDLGARGLRRTPPSTMRMHPR
jgi:aryl-alcohol dehydrogenase-like predicted oxidoreductase